MTLKSSISLILLLSLVLCSSCVPHGSAGTASRPVCFSVEEAREIRLKMQRCILNKENCAITTKAEVKKALALCQTKTQCPPPQYAIVGVVSAITGAIVVFLVFLPALILK